MTALHPTHTILVEGYCAECGQDLGGAGVYADQNGSEVECPLCHSLLNPGEEGDILEARTEPQELVWGLVAQADAWTWLARKRATEAEARLEEVRRQNDLLRMKAHRLQDAYDEVTRG